MGDLFILSSVSTIKRYSSSIDMTLPIRSDLRDSNHRCSLGLDISPRWNCLLDNHPLFLPSGAAINIAIWRLYKRSTAGS